MKDFQTKVLAALEALDGVNSKDVIDLVELRDDLDVLDRVLVAYVDSTEHYAFAYAFMRSIQIREADEHFSELDNEQLELLAFCTSLILIPDDQCTLFSYDGIENELNNYIDEHCTDTFLSNQLRKENTFEELKESFLQDYNEYFIDSKDDTYFY